ncbi:LysR family transcriptional regulator [Ensifer sp. ENS05]|uniref:LysR family transcriptional regulator n=1 Tax=Ensifer sp. ENS05 TaxID=2769277 RepID=UPI00177B790D|nr:LysR family transcriptional regulator [Ensifer sp. ENS05]MBD9597351.1 LysR family transcriptional regulator [Ensifer sp. ENS05]
MTIGPKSLNARQLEAFRAVMMSGSITRAARLLAISQPAVTRLIRDLEIELGMKLFSRDGATVMPTPEAREFYVEVQRHFISTERLRDIAVGIREFGAGRLRLAAIPALSGHCLPDAITAYAADFPNTIVSVHNGASADIIDLVATSQADLAIGARMPGRGDLSYRDLPEAQAVCILPKTHPLARQAEITPADMDGQDYISLGQSSLMRLELEALLRAANSHPRLRVESLFSGTLVHYVDRGLGLAIVDPLVASMVDPGRTVVRRFVPRIRYSLSVVYAPNIVRSPMLERFVDIFTETYERLTADIATHIA